MNLKEIRVVEALSVCNYYVLLSHELVRIVDIDFNEMVNIQFNDSQLDLRKIIKNGIEECLISLEEEEAELLPNGTKEDLLMIKEILKDV